MLKTSLKFFIIIFAVLVTFLSFAFETQIRQIIPAFSVSVVLSGMLLITGTTLAIVIRNIGIFVVSLAMAFALPFLVKWFVQYWPHFSTYYLS